MAYIYDSHTLYDMAKIFEIKKHKFLLTQEIIEFYEGNRELSFYNYDKYRLKILTIVLSSINNISKIYLN